MFNDFKYWYWPTPPKSKFLSILGRIAYILFGLISTLTAFAAAGFWPGFAWIILIIFGPKLFREL